MTVMLTEKSVMESADRTKWERLFLALDSLAKASLEMIDVGRWYVHQDLGIKKGPFIYGGHQVGSTPEQATLTQWDYLTRLKDNEFIVVYPTNPDRRGLYRWNGFMWQRYEE